MRCSWWVIFVPAFFLLLFLSSAAVAAGPQVAETLAAVVDFVVISLLAAGSWGDEWVLVARDMWGKGEDSRR